MLVHYGNHRHYQLSVLSNPIQIRDTLIVHSCCNLGSCTGLQQRSDSFYFSGRINCKFNNCFKFSYNNFAIIENLGVIWQISDYLLGLIVFAISNSLNDGITNVTISTKINPILGINSCIGTPLLIILLGIGGSGLIVTSRSHKDILFNLTDNVVISAAGLIFSICCLIIYLPWNNYRVDAKIGNFLLLLYIVMTGVEICLEY